MVLLLIIVGNIFNGLGVLLNMKYSMPNDLVIKIDGGGADRRKDNMPRAKRQIRDTFNNLGYGLIILGILLNLIAAIILYNN